MAKLARIREELLQEPTPTKNLGVHRDHLLRLNEELAAEFRKHLARSSAEFLDGIQTDQPKSPG